MSEENQEQKVRHILNTSKPLKVFPTLDTPNEVFELGMSKLPIEDKNTLYALLATYHNTLLNQVKK